MYSKSRKSDNIYLAEARFARRKISTAARCSLSRDEPEGRAPACVASTSVWCTCVGGEACGNAVRAHAGRACGQGWHLACLDAFAPAEGAAAEDSV